jgi:acyl-coenzyme A synthetase/AMP-(fatty) acid ligase
VNFVEMILYFGRAMPEKQAIVLSDRVVSFGMLAMGIRSVETAIKAAGITPAETVGIRIESPTRHVIVASALYRLGIVSVSLNGNEDLSNAGLKIDVSISDVATLPPAFGRVVALADDWFARRFDASETPAGFRDEDQLARIIMSSGTTAAPKAIGHTVRVVEDRIITGRRTLALAPWDRMMCLPVMTSSLGFGSVLQALAYGHAVVIAESPLDALQMIALYGVDLLVANPQHLRAMVEAHRENPVPTPSLRLVKYGGNALAPQLATEIRQRLCKDVLCVYSSTESGPIAFSHIDHVLANPGATGIVAPWVDVEILGPDDKPVAAGMSGRLRVRSRWQGYDLKEGPEAARRWMYPGDIGSVSAKGILSLVGRAADAIPVGGAYVAPEQIEQALFGYPGIDDVAAAGMPSASGGQEIQLAVISAGGIDAEALKRFLLSKNPLWQVARVKMVDKFRRNDMGKIVRSRVREILAA